jgi:hypothetical protein
MRPVFFESKDIYHEEQSQFCFPYGNEGKKSVDEKKATRDTGGLGKALTSTTRSGFYTDSSTPYLTTTSPPVNKIIPLVCIDTLQFTFNTKGQILLSHHARNRTFPPTHTLCFHAYPLSLLPRVKAAQQRFREFLLTTISFALQVHLQTGQCVSYSAPLIFDVRANPPRVTKSVLPSGSFTCPQQHSRRRGLQLTTRLCRQTISGEHGLDGSGV